MGLEFESTSAKIKLESNFVSFCFLQKSSFLPKAETDQFEADLNDYLKQGGQEMTKKEMRAMKRARKSRKDRQ